MKYSLAIILFIFSITLRHHPRMALVTDGKIDGALISEIKKRVYRTYRIRIDSIGETEMPSYKEYGYDERLVIHQLEHQNHRGYRGIIGLINDTILQDMQYYRKSLYGATRGDASIVSGWLLDKDEKYNSRMVNVVLHEIGHQLGLEHCTHNPRCLMIEYDSLDNDSLCDSCKHVLKKIRRKHDKEI